MQNTARRSRSSRLGIYLSAFHRTSATADRHRTRGSPHHSRQRELPGSDFELVFFGCGVMVRDGDAADAKNCGNILAGG
jgi:hypothetical protein